MLENGEAVIRLRCEKREVHGTGKNRHLNVTILWQDQKTVPLQPAGLGIDVSFSIPGELPEAAPDRAEGIFWILQARSATPGIDYGATFDLALRRLAS